MLCKLAGLYCVSTDHLLGRDEPVESIPKNDEIISVEMLRALNGKPVWDNAKGVQDYVLFMDGSKIVLAEAMNLQAMAPAYSMGYSTSTKPISHGALNKYSTIWIKPITPDSFLRDGLTGWYKVHDFYVQNQYETRLLFDTYGTRWLAFEIVDRFNMSAAAISKHLSILRAAELVRSRRDGKYIYYELSASVIEEVLLWLTDLKEDAT